ncbi:MAG TPA: M12 family metallopeptidase [Chitinophagaceae bacterium]
MRTMYLLAVLLIISALPAAAQKQNIKAKKFATCTTKEPVMNFTMDTAKPRGLADNYYLWDNGKTLNVKFLSGSQRLQDIIKSAAKEWEKYANIKFNFVSSGPAQIRVLLTDHDGYWSMVGQQATMIPDDEQTMSLDTTGGHFQQMASLRGTVMHEFGHSIGLLHEHSSPVSGIQWNKEAVYKDLEGTWDRATVDAQIFETYKVSYTNGTKYDNKSIMHYPIPARHTLNGYQVDWNWQISAGDKEIAGLLYPKGGKSRINEVPRFTIDKFTSMDVVNGTEKVSLYPSFEISTAGKEGTVYFMVFFYDENGDAIEDTDDKYNISGIVGTYDFAMLQPGKRLTANKGARDFELSIPKSQLPVSSGSKVMAVFKSFLFNDNEFKLLYASTPFVFNMK